MADFTWRSVRGETSRKRDCAPAEYRLWVGTIPPQAVPGPCFPGPEPYSQTMRELELTPPPYMRACGRELLPGLARLDRSRQILPGEKIRGILWCAPTR